MNAVFEETAGGVFCIFVRDSPALPSSSPPIPLYGVGGEAMSLGFMAHHV